MDPRRDREASRHRPQRCGIVRSAWARRHTLDAMVFGLQPLPLSATRAQRNCDGGYALRDGSATEGYALRDGWATDGHALRYGWGTPEIRMRYGIHHAATVSERLRRVRYVTGKDRIISLLRPSRKADSRSRRRHGRRGLPDPVRPLPASERVPSPDESVSGGARSPRGLLRRSHSSRFRRQMPLVPVRRRRRSWLVAVAFSHSCRALAARSWSGARRRSNAKILRASIGK